MLWTVPAGGAQLLAMTADLRPFMKLSHSTAFLWTITRPLVLSMITVNLTYHVLHRDSCILGHRSSHYLLWLLFNRKSTSPATLRQIWSLRDFHIAHLLSNKYHLPLLVSLAFFHKCRTKVLTVALQAMENKHTKRLSFASRQTNHLDNLLLSSTSSDPWCYSILVNKTTYAFTFYLVWCFSDVSTLSPGCAL